MKLFGLTAFVTIGATAFAQSPAPVKPASIDGKVVNATTGEPLRKVDLTLSNSLIDNEQMEAAMAMFADTGITSPLPPQPKVEKKDYKVTTDADGKFHLAGVDPGGYFLTAKRPGFVDERYNPGTGKGADGQVQLAAGDQLNGIVMRMTQQGAASGRVLDEDGDPVANAMVTALSVNYSTGKRKLLPADTGQTNDRGEYRLGKLPPGHYYLSASSMHMMDFMNGVAPAPKDDAPEIDYVATYYPRTVDAAIATKVDIVPAADVTALTIHLQKSKVTRVKGQAVDANGAPLKGGQVMLMSTSNMGAMQMGMVGPEGKFELAHVQPGSYMLMSIQMSGAKPSMTMQSIVVPERGLADVKVGAQAEKTVTGRIAVEGNTKLDLKKIRVMLAGGEAATMPVFGMVSAAGDFSLKVAATQHEAKVTGVPPGAYLKSVLLNGRDVIGKSLDFGSTAGDLLLTLGTDGGSVDASVLLGDKSLFDASVVLLPVDAARRVPEAIRSESSDQGGHAKFKDVPPGDYLVCAWEKVEDGEWFDPDTAKIIEKQAVRVTVGAGGSEKVEVKAIPRG